MLIEKKKGKQTNKKKIFLMHFKDLFFPCLPFQVSKKKSTRENL
jgi:hypothetical protein